MKRFKHSLSHYQLATFDMGQLVPVANFEVLPGDSIRMSSSCLIRVSPLVKPVMHPVTVRLHHWFVPYRLLWEGWEDFITGGPDGTGSSEAWPELASDLAIDESSLGNYMGIPVNSIQQTNAFPFMAYRKIYNEFYRDQDLVASLDEGGSGENGNAVLGYNDPPLNVAWEKDAFTAARPWTQKGPEVTLPLGGTAPVLPNPDATIPDTPTFSGTGVASTTLSVNVGDPSNVVIGSAVSGTTGLSWNDPALIADIAAASSVPVNDVRLAFALQRYQEARAQFGSRYSEYLRYLGVRSSDARLQRPEYLGGGKSTIAFSEVLQTTPIEGESSVGSLYGHGITAQRTRSWMKFFEEHGVVMTLASVRPKTMYVDGLHRSMIKRTKEEFWQKELELVGQQEVFNAEVMATHSEPFGVLGYQDRYYEYRHHPSRVAGEFQTTELDWHLGRTFAGDVALNQDFVECVPSKRIHAVQTNHVLWGMFSHSIQARRMVGNRTIGRIL